MIRVYALALLPRDWNWGGDRVFAWEQWSFFLLLYTTLLQCFIQHPRRFFSYNMFNKPFDIFAVFHTALALVIFSHIFFRLTNSFWVLVLLRIFESRRICLMSSLSWVHRTGQPWLGLQPGRWSCPCLRSLLPGNQLPVCECFANNSLWAQAEALSVSADLEVLCDRFCWYVFLFFIGIALKCVAD